MTGVEIAALIGLLSASVNGIKTLMPIIRDALNNSDLTQDQLDKLRSEYDSLRNQSGPDFTGSEFELSGR